ncbi:Flagellar export protein FliJ [Rubrivivax sp. A210]|uniref:flagellar protein FliT n=1 Tax=Rubrivivax sp. A210 TaxID=2772301 RepID=UPI00191A1DD2|nr:flagellar protein FliT [Rubrivivax sp. A210]CAD5373628.1 Flagellar export protein FliJ [Rubrivivax sp. A210]
MDAQLLNYYEAIERASADMLAAARAGNWDEVVKLEGACVLLISQLKNAAQERPREACTTAHAGVDTQAFNAARAKSRIMQRILVNDAEIRHLAEPWLQDLDDTLSGRRKTLH